MWNDSIRIQVGKEWVEGAPIESCLLFVVGWLTSSEPSAFESKELFPGSWLVLVASWLLTPDSRSN